MKELTPPSELAGLAANLIQFTPSGRSGKGARTKLPNRTKETSPSHSDVISEDSVAQEFITRYGQAVRYDHDAKVWFIWTGSHWRKDTTHLAFSYAVGLARELTLNGSEAARKSAGRAAFARGVEEIASRTQSVSVTRGVWDLDQDVLGTPNGVVDLKTGLLHPATPDSMITKQALVGPSEKEECPLWLKFLGETAGNDPEMIEFLQRWAGYCLTGQTIEQVLAFLYGLGGNGKSVFVNALARIMGDYARSAGMETFTASQNERHPEELARLAGARLVFASETDSGRKWAEARVKRITGGEPIPARFMHQNSFEFTPQFKLTILGNHAPTIDNLDDAMRRRFLIVPFTIKPAEPDLRLEEKLMAEAPGILRWAINGAVKWYAGRLTRPAKVDQATQEYFAEQDIFASWVQEECDRSPGNSAMFEKTAILYSSWKDYCLRAGEPSGSQKDFNAKLRRLGLANEQIKALGTKGVRTIRLKIKSSYHEPRDDYA